MSQISTPRSSANAQPMLMKLRTYRLTTACRKTTQHAKRYFNQTTWVVLANCQFATIRFLCLFLFSSSRLHRSHPWTDFDVCRPLRHMTSFHAKMCLLRVRLIGPISPIYGVKFSKNRNFGA